MCMDILLWCVCVCTYHKPSWYSRSQKRVMEPSKLELHIVVSCPRILGIEPGSCGAAASALNH